MFMKTVSTKFFDHDLHRRLLALLRGLWENDLHAMAKAVNVRFEKLKKWYYCESGIPASLVVGVSRLRRVDRDWLYGHKQQAVIEVKRVIPSRHRVKLIFNGPKVEVRVLGKPKESDQ